MNYQDRYILLNYCNKLLQYPTKVFINILNDNHIKQTIFQQTFKTLSPSAENIIIHLSKEKLHRNMSRVKKNIVPKTSNEVKKLFDEIKPYINNHDIIKQYR